MLSGARHARPSGANLAELLWSAGAGVPARTAIRTRERLISYGTLTDRAASVASMLVESGLIPGDRVAILLERGIDAIASLFGVYAAGGVAIVINDRLRTRQIDYILEHAGVAALLTTKDMLGRQHRRLETSVSTIDLGTVSARAAFTPRHRVSGDFAQIIYTSGSTGLPKGVTFTHGALWSALTCVIGYLGLRSDDRIASVLPFSSVYGLNQVLCALGTRAALVIDQSPVPNQIVETLRAEKVTVLAAVPPLWLQLLNTPAFAEPLPALRLLQNAGGHFPVDGVRRLRSMHNDARLFLQYGLTETFRSTFLAPGEVDRRPESIGQAIPCAEVLIAREDHSLCETEEVGELVHRGPTIACGYWNDPKRTAEVFRPNPWLGSGAPTGERVVFSGDLVRRDADGFLHFVSRSDELIRSLGFRVGPDEIMDVVFASGEVLEGVVTTEPDTHRGVRIIVTVVLKGSGSASRLASYCRAELPRHMQPARIDLRQAIPRLASGKYDLPMVIAERLRDAKAPPPQSNAQPVVPQPHYAGIGSNSGVERRM
jgi:acyl-CoA synthetase (AMP-forming)/AMP-acid ligase II